DRRDDNVERGLQQRWQFVEDDRAVRARGEEGAGAEIGVASVAAEDIPGRRQDDVLQHYIGSEEEVLVGEEQPGQDYDGKTDSGRANPEHAAAHGLASQ